MTSRHVVLLAVALLSGAEGRALARQAPASVSGVVVTMDRAARPVRRAIVTLSGDVRPARSAVTDDNGRFEFTGVPAGRFALKASRASYVTNAYGAKAPGRPGTMIALAAGQRLTDLRVELPRGAVITGVVRGPDGAPAPNVQVNVVPAELASAGGELQPSNTLLTDDGGAYRAFGLEPGAYLVMASVRLIGAGDIGLMAPADIDALFSTLQSGARPGPPAGTTNTLNTAASAPPARVPTVGYAPIFYSGTPVASDATRVTVGVGEERAGIDIALQPVHTASIEGVVLNFGTTAATSVQLSMAPNGPPLPFLASLTSVANSRVSADGQFKFAGVTPGSYTLTARLVPSSGRAAGPAVPPPAPVTAMWAAAQVTMGGADVTGVSLALQPGMRLAGRLAFDATTLAPPTSLTNLRVTLAPPGVAAGSTPVILNGTLVGTTPSPGLVKADGTFEIAGIMPGAYTLTSVVPSPGPTGWWLRSVVVGGRDLLDGPIVFADGRDLSDAVVTFSDRHTSLEGALQTPAGQPATEYYVILLPADRALWAATRRVQSTRPASDGSFSVRDLPSGDYLIVALTDVAPNEWKNPAFLEQIAPAGVKVTIGEGETKRQVLRVGG